jgi:hypothetical membrane protein
VKPFLPYRLTAILGSAATGSWLACYLVAALSYPGYDMTRHYLSDLGHPLAPGAWAFNLGAILSGVLFVPTSWALGQAVGGRPGAAAGALGAVAAGFLVLVGFFPEESPNNMHFLVSSGFFLCQLAAAGILMVPLHRSPMFGPVSGLLAAATIGADLVFIPARALEASVQYIAEHVSVFVALTWTLWNARRFWIAGRAGTATSPAPSAGPGRGPLAP